MSDIAGLMHAIHDLPHDDLPRLAFADWLEEHGQAERAEFIRVQIALAKVNREDEECYRPLHDREVALMIAHKDVWFGVFRSAWRYYDCQRGFIDQIWANADAFLPHASWFHEHHALQHVRLEGGLEELSAMLSSPVLPAVRSLSFDRRSVGPDTLTRNLPPSNEPLERRPLHLAVGGMPTGMGLVDVLTAQPLPTRLASLDLNHNLLEPAALAALLDALPSWPKLVRLHLRECFGAEGDECIVSLAHHPALARIEELDLSLNRLARAGVLALTSSPHLRGLRRLILHNMIGLTTPQRRRLRGRFGEQLVGLGAE